MNFKNILGNEIKHAVLYNNCLEEKEIWEDYIRSKSSKNKKRHFLNSQDNQPEDLDTKISKYMEKREREIRKAFKIQNELKIIEKKNTENSAKFPNLFDWTGVAERWTHDLYDSSLQQNDLTREDKIKKDGSKSQTDAQSDKSEEKCRRTGKSKDRKKQKLKKLKKSKRSKDLQSNKNGSDSGEIEWIEKD